MGRSKRRVTNDNANRRLPADVLSPYDASRQLSFDFEGALRALEDRRTYHPEGPFRPARGFFSPRSRLVASPYPKPRPMPRNKDRFGRLRDSWKSVPAYVAFEVPRQVAICVRRKIRREVMHAFKKAGKRGQKRKRLNWYSKVRCK